MTTCPCGSGLTYEGCCGRFHRGEAAAPTATELMRSRFSAFARGEVAYLLRTWHPSTRPPFIDLDRRLRWTSLEIVSTTGGSSFHTEGIVEFRAHYTHRGEEGAMEEKSRFLREGGKWLYVEAL